jgi:hypothetical protein
LALAEHAENQPGGARDDDYQNHPAQQDRQEEGVQHGHFNWITAEGGESFRQPVPGGMRSERGQDDRSDPFGDDISEKRAKYWHEHKKNKDLAELDSGIEGNERRQQMRSRKLKGFA